MYTGTPCPAKVGIGIANPVTTLDVSGTGHFTSNLSIGMDNTNDYKLAIKQSYPSRSGILLDMSHVNNQAYGLRINSQSLYTKALAITNANGDENFLVKGNGNLWATNIKVRSESDFPDYVFEEGYKLMSLKELAVFIEKEKHLPNIPTAEEVKVSGLDIGKINTLLVEKVEELTLYAIEQDKSLELQIEELKSLKLEMELLKVLLSRLKKD